ncbi:hypothetical protein BOTCAL_0822g00010 [Botryotinia calthae]|uniref:Uncharacterized protein n=1 Tax=Botryotinia calthae TaxID=38488 RepID=A0A4Y8CI87_9HELO|nr:hypothetical protein BOTCAL_0822g00010 [Botryotinia calthae]
MVLLSKFMSWLLLTSTATATQTSNDMCHADQDLSSYDPFELQALRSEWITGVDKAFREHGAILQEPTDAEIALIPETHRNKAKEEHAKWYKIKWEHLPNILKNWILEHPWQTAFHIVNGAVFFTPAGASGLVLRVLGFTSAGPRAASFASFIQSKIGLVVAKSWFALFQSVPMGGWGAPFVHTATQIGALTNGFGAAFWEWTRGNSTA